MSIPGSGSWVVNLHSSAELSVSLLGAEGLAEAGGSTRSLWAGPERSSQLPSQSQAWSDSTQVTQISTPVSLVLVWLNIISNTILQ